MRTYDDTLRGMVGCFAIYTQMSSGWWAYDVVATFGTAAERAKKAKAPVMVKKITSLEGAEQVDHMVQKYEDWATD